MEYVKYIVFFITLFAGVPIGYSFAKKSEKFENFIYFLTIFFTSRIDIHINFISREDYRGTSRGFEITLVDLFVLILLLLVINRKHLYKIKLLPPGSFLFFLFILFSAFSISNSAVPLYSFFELWKIIRMYFFYWIMYNYIQDLKQLDMAAKFIGITILCAFLVVLQQKYLQGRFQCPGPFPHQNSMVMYMIIFGSIMFSALMNSKATAFNTYFYLASFGMASICVISSLSRAGMALYALAILIILVLSYSSGLNLKKIGLTLLFVLMGFIVIYKAMDSIRERFTNAPENSANTRIELANAACAMADDYTFGVGLNNFSLRMLEPFNYYLYRNKGAWEEGGIVETTYLLIAAETGWINLATYLLFILSFYFRNLMNYFRYKKTDYNYIAIGLIGALTAIYIESALEWVLRQTNNFFQLMFVFAIIGAMTRIAKQGKLTEDDNFDEEAANEKTEEEDDDKGTSLKRLN